MNKQANERPDWDAIRKAVEAEKMPLARIARKFGINRTTLYRRRKLWHEEKLAVCAELLVEEDKEASQGPTNAEDGGTDKGERLTLVERLYHATDQQIRHLESRLASGEAAFDEKEARMLGTIARTLDKIMDLKPKQAKAASATNSKDTIEKKEPEDGKDNERALDALRTDLAQRLERLQQTDKNPLSGKPQPK